MYMNLFSSFNPSSIPYFNLNWLSMLIFLIIIPYPFWILNSQFTHMFYILSTFLSSELKIILVKKSNLLNSGILLTIFSFILIINFSSLYPFVFSSSSHLSFSLTLSLSIFLALMIRGWTCNPTHMFAHMIPLNTPPILIPFMNMIEFTSNIIRPITLSIRLSANVIAGHLLITLLCSSMSSSTIILSVIMLIFQLILMFLEINVSMIQSYVFTILSTLYSSEVN
uniref:ATP synthase subunit a n=1 Tax=Evania appendigaster TaxID=27486 RepID=C8YLX8_EVAAP|nr:ATP synthase F0 subunit 6 [Evania appendigaster]ACL36003.1 ATP synthase F0 subunit 6 [Evania appendigaster]